jgi:arylsulfatase A-like enzyme
MLGQSGISEYFDGMIEHDGDVGKFLNALDDLNIANNTIVVYSTDNGPHMNSWPDGGYTPFRNEKNSNWEGAFRVPAMVRWPGHIRPGSVSNDMVSGLDWFPTLLAVAGDTGVKDRLLAGWQVGGRTYKNHLDGYNQLPYLTGQQDKSARNEFFYFNDDGQLVAVRYESWNLYSASSGSKARLRSGASRSPACGRRKCTTCAWTRTSERTSPRTLTMST